MITTTGVSSLLIIGSNFGIFRILEWSTLDQFFRLRPQETIDQRIVIVTIDEADIQYVKQWPMSDAVMAKVIKNITLQQPRAIAIDIYRDLPVTPGHQELVTLFKNTPNVIGIQKIAGSPIAPAPTLDKLGQVAANDSLMDRDGVIRRSVILLKKSNNSLIQSLGVRLALMYLTKEGIELNAINEDKQIYGLGKAKFVPLSKHDGEYNEADMGGYQILINYRGGLDKFAHISMTEVLKNQIPAQLMRDRIVLLGATAPSLNDNYATPYNNTLFSTTDLMPGIVIHANITSQVISAALDGRTQLRAISKYHNWLLIIFWSGYSASLGAIFISKRWLTISGLLLAIIVIISSSYIAFVYGWLVPLFTPLVAIICAAIVSIGQILWQNLMFSYHQLEQSEKRFRTLVANIPGAIYRYQCDHILKLNFISETISNISGYPASDFVNDQVRTYASIIHPQDKDMVTNTVQKAITTKEPYLIEYRIITYHNQIRWVFEQGRGVFDIQGNLLCLDGAIFDISDRKQAQEALRIAEENYRSIFENALEGIFQSSLDGHYLNVNPTLAQIYGYDSPTEMIRSITDIKQIYVNPDDRDYFRQLLDQQGQIKDWEYQVYRKDGTVIWIEEDTRVVRDSNGTILYFEGIIQDITDRKLKEQAMQQQLEELKIEIDQKKRQEDVAKITQSDYFQDLQAEIEEYQADTFWDLE